MLRSLGWWTSLGLGTGGRKTKMDEGKYRIRVAAEMTGTTAPQLRVWEKRYGIPQPRRSSSRYRLYSDEDVRELKSMRQLVLSGMQPSEAAKRVKENRIVTQAPIQADLAHQTRTLMLDAIYNYDMRALDEQLNLLLRSGSVAESWSLIIQPLLADIGEAWFQGDLDPAQEHLASNGVRYTLQTMYRLIEPKHPHGMVVLACVANERHDLPLLGLGIELATLGWRSLMVGADVPAESVRATVDTGVELVGLSITMPLDVDCPRTFWQTYANAMNGVPWVVGGRSAALYEADILDLGGLVIRSDSEATEYLKKLSRDKQ